MNKNHCICIIFMVLLVACALDAAAIEGTVSPKQVEGKWKCVIEGASSFVKNPVFVEGICKVECICDTPDCNKESRELKKTEPSYTSFCCQNTGAYFYCHYNDPAVTPANQPIMDKYKTVAGCFPLSDYIPSDPSDKSRILPYCGYVPVGNVKKICIENLGLDPKIFTNIVDENCVVSGDYCVNQAGKGLELSKVKACPDNKKEDWKKGNACCLKDEECITDSNSLGGYRCKTGEEPRTYTCKPDGANNNCPSLCTVEDDVDCGVQVFDLIEFVTDIVKAFDNNTGTHLANDIQNLTNSWYEIAGKAMAWTQEFDLNARLADLTTSCILTGFEECDWELTVTEKATSRYGGAAPTVNTSWGDTTSEGVMPYISIYSYLTVAHDMKAFTADTYFVVGYMAGNFQEDTDYEIYIGNQLVFSGSLLKGEVKNDEIQVPLDSFIRTPNKPQDACIKFNKVVSGNTDQACNRIQYSFGFDWNSFKGNWAGATFPQINNTSYDVK